MNHILVIPFNEKLISRLKHQAIIVTTGDFNILQYIQQKVNDSNHLHAIQIKTNKPLSEIDFQEEWKRLPLALYSPDFGIYKNFLHRLNVLRSLNIRIFLSSDIEFNFTALKILSSLNISCGLHFDNGPYNWELINDLMHYTIYSNTRRAPIEPFVWLASNYDPAGYTDFNSVYFNDPSRYLYINENEQIALSGKDLLENNFIASGIGSLDKIRENAKYRSQQDFRYEIMLSMNECAFCQGFRICLGKFSKLENKAESCKPFFSDFLDGADYFHTRNKTGDKLWQL